MVKENISWALQRPAELFRSRVAVIDGDARFTYGEFARRVAALDASLDRLGLRAGDVVAVLALNSHQHLEAWFAVPRGGLVLNDLNWRLAPAELEFIVEDCEAAALIVDQAFLDVGRRLAERCGSIRHLIEIGQPGGELPYEQLAAGGGRPAGNVSPEALAGIFYTGGTTGRPKGVMLSHANLVANAKHVIMGWDYRPDDRYLHAGPMFHLADGASTFAVSWVGGTHVIVPMFEPEQVARVIERERVTKTTLVPTMINLLVNHPRSAEFVLSSLRRVAYGGSPMPADLQRRAMHALACEFAQAYGMTEAAPLVSLLSPEDHLAGLSGEPPHAERLASAGLPVVGVQVEIRRADGTRAAEGEPGEIYVRGPNVMQGYWRREAETAAALDADGWYHSGDAAYVDQNGYIYVVDRVKDMIISGGENVYCTEVENALYSHPAVLEAAVFGVPDERWGERVHAAVVLRPGARANEEELTAHCREQLAGYKLPRSFEFHEQALPKSGAGKILKRDLREPHWAPQARRVS
jgi:long-chain acyl-CoA synthetase